MQPYLPRNNMNIEWQQFFNEHMNRMGNTIQMQLQQQYLIQKRDFESMFSSWSQFVYQNLQAHQQAIVNYLGKLDSMLQMQEAIFVERFNNLHTLTNHQKQVTDSLLQGMQDQMNSMGINTSTATGTNFRGKENFLSLPANNSIHTQVGY